MPLIRIRAQHSIDGKKEKDRGAIVNDAIDLQHRSDGQRRLPIEIFFFSATRNTARHRHRSRPLTAMPILRTTMVLEHTEVQHGGFMS